ncbi:uncharacterized protein LOC120298743 [Crotalus tigris]|uniref:uncharacterized protein LOC120298743 n=1 Tax=Crotalus tigris TaxID=88082 RepID=UPI00192F1F74|nr:uncharacterized protein LOC120298743 [Crotalus tigris]
MANFDKLFPLNFPRRLHDVLSSINFLLLLVTTSSPLLLRFRLYQGYFLNGWWTVCDGYSCNSVRSSSGPLIAAQVLAVAAVFFGFIALISSWKLLACLIGREITENLISSVAHFGTGLFLLSALLITYCNLRIKIDVHNNKMKPYYGFFLGCFVCFLSFFLGTISLLYYKGLIKEKENVICDINAEAQGEIAQSDNEKLTV